MKEKLLAFNFASVKLGLIVSNTLHRSISIVPNTYKIVSFTSFADPNRVE